MYVSEYRKQEYPDTHLLPRYCKYSVAQVLALYFKFSNSIQKWIVWTHNINVLKLVFLNYKFVFGQCSHYYNINISRSKALLKIVACSKY